MTPLLLLSLLGLALIIPVLSDDDTPEEAEPPLPEPEEEPVAPEPPEVRAPIIGTEDADRLGASSNDTINAGDGDDTLFVDSTFETDEDGVETRVRTTNVTFNGEAGNDRIVSVGGVTDMVANGGLGDDTIAVVDGGGNGLLLNGNEGNDELRAQGINATLNGGDGDDDIFGDSSNSILNGDAGNDTIGTISSNNTLNGGQGDDRISATGSAIEINGDAGDDDIFYSGSDGFSSAPGTFGGTVHGGAGDDTISMENSNPSITAAFFGDEGEDVLVSFDFDRFNPYGDASMDGGIGNDTLIGDAGDTLTGGTGADVFRIAVDQEDTTPRPATSEIIEITDFNRGEDVIEIFIRDTGGALVTPENIELTRAEDGSFTDITVTANGAGDGGPVSDTFRIIGISDLTLDDLVLVEDAQRPART